MTKRHRNPEGTVTTVVEKNVNAAGGQDPTINQQKNKETVNQQKNKETVGFRNRIFSPGSTTAGEQTIAEAITNPVGGGQGDSVLGLAREAAAISGLINRYGNEVKEETNKHRSDNQIPPITLTQEATKIANLRYSLGLDDKVKKNNNTLPTLKGKEDKDFVITKGYVDAIFKQNNQPVVNYFVLLGKLAKLQGQNAERGEISKCNTELKAAESELDNSALKFFTELKKVNPKVQEYLQKLYQVADLKKQEQEGGQHSGVPATIIGQMSYSANRMNEEDFKTIYNFLTQLLAIEAKE